MRIKKIQNNFINILILFLIPSFYSWLYYLFRFYKNPKKNLFYYSFISASILILMIPMFDIVYTFDSFLFIKDLSIKEFMKYKLPLYHYFYYFGGKFFSFWNIYFIVIFLLIYIYNKAYVRSIKNNGSNEIIFLIFIFSLWYRNILDITRYTLACIVYIYCVLNYLNNKKGKYLIILSVFFHNSFIIFVALFYISIVIKKLKMNLNKFFIFCIFILIILKIIENKLLIIIEKCSKYLSLNFYKRLNNYVLNKNNVLEILKNSEVETIKFLIILSTLIIFGIIFFNICKKNRNKKFIEILVMELYFFTLFFLNSYVLNERLFILIYLLMIIFFFFTFNT